jgi:glycerophosphoryl diester phosphodiesterase
LSERYARRRVAAAALLSLVVLGGSAGRAAAAPASCDAMPMPVAHRGGTESMLENTVGAFRSAGAAGFRRWELDVRFDANGTPVVLHDETVDRVSPRSGRIEDLDATTTRIPTNDGQWIPTLREVYDEAVRARATVLTEFKVMPSQEQWAAVAAEIDATVGRRSVVAMSFDREIVAAARRQIPGTDYGLLNNAGYLAPEQISEYGSALMQSYRTISRSRADSWHAGGITVYAWTVDDEAGWRSMAAAGSDAVITDRPTAYDHWVADQC